MVARVGKPSAAPRTGVVLAILAVLAGCGSSVKGGLSAGASADVDPPVRPVSNACAATVLSALGDVTVRVYREGVHSERTASAVSLITRSIPLRRAIEQNDSRAVRAAAQALLQTGHMTNLTVIRDATTGGGRGQTTLAKPPAGRTLVTVGAPNALAPLHGTISGSGGAPIATFIASVWADAGFVDETNGITEGATGLRENGRTVAGSFTLGAGKPPVQGTLTTRGITYRYTSFPAAVYPSGQLRVYLLRSIPSIAPLCGPTQEDTIVNTLSHIATLIYAGEAGRRTLSQIDRVQHNRALLSAVAHRDPAATKLAIDNLLNQHIVRLRVLTAGGQLLSDVGGPFVLAPRRAPLRLNGRTIGSFVLSIQDDLGYRLLAQRLAGLDVVMHRGAQVVMSSFNPAPAHVPANGSFRYKGHTYSAFTFAAEAFPSGALRITVLIPMPYS
jgi:hypothetical protein